MNCCNAIVPILLLSGTRISAVTMSWRWCTTSALALLWLVTAAPASGQTGSGGSYNRNAMIMAICRQYAATQTGMPVNLMFNQCMSERHCRVSSEPPGYQCEVPGPLEWHGGGY
jgi:hypothetical protein